MGYFGYKFIDRTPELVAERRLILDWYATLAQLSQLLVLIAFPIARILESFFLRYLNGDLDTISSPLSPRKKASSHQRRDQGGLAILITRSIRILRWRLGTEVIQGYGTWGQWIGGALWATWLAILCISETVPGKQTMPLRQF
jgi:hypothetical protein